MVLSKYKREGRKEKGEGRMMEGVFLLVYGQGALTKGPSTSLGDRAARSTEAVAERRQGRYPSEALAGARAKPRAGALR
jgi:hypothetical protein